MLGIEPRSPARHKVLLIAEPSPQAKGLFFNHVCAGGGGGNVHMNAALHIAQHTASDYPEGTLQAMVKWSLSLPTCVLGFSSL